MSYADLRRSATLINNARNGIYEGAVTYNISGDKNWFDNQAQQNINGGWSSNSGSGSYGNNCGNSPRCNLQTTSRSTNGW